MGFLALGLLISPVSYGQETCESEWDCEQGEACDSDGVCIRTKKIEDEDLLGSGKNRENQIPKLEKPNSATLRLVATVGFVGSGSLLLMRGLILRGELEIDVRSGPALNPSGGLCSDCYEDEIRRVNSRLASGYAFLGTGVILGITESLSSSGTDVALTWRGQW
jgi:hypothetical protein